MNQNQFRTLVTILCMAASPISAKGAEPTFCDIPFSELEAKIAGIEGLTHPLTLPLVDGSTNRTTGKVMIFDEYNPANNSWVLRYIFEGFNGKDADLHIHNSQGYIGVLSEQDKGMFCDVFFPNHSYNNQRPNV